MRELIKVWLQDQQDDCQDFWDFPDDFDYDKAAQWLFLNFNSEVIYEHLDTLLTDYLR